MTLVRAKITARQGEAHVELDGEDVTKKLRACRLDLAAHDVPRLTLELMSKDVIFEGEVLVRQHVAEDLGDVQLAAILAFLDALEPAMIEAEALNDVNMTTSVGAAFIGAIRRQLTGEVWSSVIR